MDNSRSRPRLKACHQVAIALNLHPPAERDLPQATPQGQQKLSAGNSSSRLKTPTLLIKTPTLLLVCRLALCFFPRAGPPGILRTPGRAASRRRCCHGRRGKWGRCSPHLAIKPQECSSLAQEQSAYSWDHSIYLFEPQAGRRRTLRDRVVGGWPLTR